MQRSESIEIGAGVSRVWEVAAKEFEHIDRWASMVERSEAVREPAFLAESPGCSGRVCVTPQGETREVLVAYDDAARTFTYEITGGGMPGFVKRATNTWTVEALGSDRSLLTMTVEMTTGGVMGALMTPMMKLGMGKVLRVNLEELKHYIETGEQHARKQKKAAA